jgi:CRISPR-associated protein Csx16
MLQALAATADQAATTYSTEGHTMTTYFVTRHPGALEWAQEEGVAVDRLVDHLDPDLIQLGDTVIGTLPVNLAAQVCERGGRYLHLSLDLPAGLRGRELSAADMRACGARLEEYTVTRSVVRGPTP